MPLYGTLDIDAALKAAPTVNNLTPETWNLPGAYVLQVSYEVDEATALNLTPPSLHPSIPPYATFSFVRFPDSPAGPFTLSLVRLIVRSGIRPRAFLLAAQTDNPDAAHGLEHGWGYKITVGEVAFSRRHNRIRGTVTIDGDTALDVQLEDPDPIGPGDLELFDSLHLVNVAGEDPVIVQVDPSYDMRTADRGPADLITFDADRWGIDGLVPTYPLVAVAGEADVTLAAPRFVTDPVTPAVRSTRRLETA